MKLMVGLKRAILTAVFACMLSVNAFASYSDFYSWQWWSTKSGYTTGTINDIMNRYLISLRYVGTNNDMLQKWLVDETGKPYWWTINDLTYQYFVVNNSTGINLQFLGNDLVFIGAQLRFNP